VTNQAKDYPFEVALPAGLAVQGVVLTDHVKSADWAERQTAFIAFAPPEVLDQVRAKLRPLLGI
jgi:mRNA interferase MazF